MLKEALSPPTNKMFHFHENEAVCCVVCDNLSSIILHCLMMAFLKNRNILQYNIQYMITDYSSLFLFLQSLDFLF